MVEYISEWLVLEFPARRNGVACASFTVSVPKRFMASVRSHPLLCINLYTRKKKRFHTQNTQKNGFSDPPHWKHPKSRNGFIHSIHPCCIYLHALNALQVLKVLVRMGAPPRILLDGKPHLGTDRLVRMLQQFRAQLKALGVSEREGVSG